MKVLIVFYSTYGHIFKMAEAVAEGVKEVAGAEVKILRVPETLPDEVLGKMGAVDAQKAFSHISFYFFGSCRAAASRSALTVPT